MRLEEQLRERVSEAKSRLSTMKQEMEELRAAIGKTEQELRIWQDALRLAIHGKLPDAPSNDSAFGRLVGDLVAGLSGYSAEDAKNKTSLVMATIRKVGQPLASADLVKLLEPTVSRSMVFKAIADLKAEGKIKSLNDGRLLPIDTDAEKDGKKQEAHKGAS